MNALQPLEERIHPDFLFHDGEHWFYNKRMDQAAGLMPSRDSQKVRILLNDAELRQLDGCPYIAKIGPSADPDFPLKYCAFLYPQPGSETIDDIVAWVERRSFPNASIFTYGETGRRTGQWIPGERVRKLNTTALAPATTGSAPS